MAVSVCTVRSESGYNSETKQTLPKTWYIPIGSVFINRIIRYWEFSGHHFLIKKRKTIPSEMTLSDWEF